MKPYKNRKWTYEKVEIWKYYIYIYVRLLHNELPRWPNGSVYYDVVGYGGGFCFGNDSRVLANTVTHLSSSLEETKKKKKIVRISDSSLFPALLDNYWLFPEDRVPRRTIGLDSSCIGQSLFVVFRDESGGRTSSKRAVGDTRCHITNGLSPLLKPSSINVYAPVIGENRVVIITCWSLLVRNSDGNWRDILARV